MHNFKFVDSICWIFVVPNKYLTNCRELFPRTYSGRGMKFVIYLRLVLRVKNDWSYTYASLRTP
jgi:hypothetical protein